MNNKTKYEQLHEKLYPNKVYHIICRGINGIDIFRHPKDYERFLTKFKEYVEPIAFTYTYCLMPNHAHFLIKIKPFHQLPEKIKSKGNNPQIPKYIMYPFSNFFNSYTKFFNKKHSRENKLFSLPFKRILVNDEDYFKWLIFYIHRNPIHHKFIYILDEWKYSSYWEYRNKNEQWFSTKTFEKYFDSKENFRKQHHKIIENFLDEEFLE